MAIGALCVSSATAASVAGATEARRSPTISAAPKHGGAQELQAGAAPGRAAQGPLAGTAREPQTDGAPDRVAPAHDAFGFRLGEQRRYALGPSSILRAGEFQVWTIRLDRIHDGPGLARYTFTYGREYSLLDERSGQMSSVRAQMSVTVNQHGFPLEIKYGSRDRDASTTDFARKNGVLSWRAGAYFFEPPEGAMELPFSVPLPEDPRADPSVPAGVFLSETENPALITLPAAIFQATGATEMEYLSLRPNRLGAQGRRRAGGGPGGFGRGGLSRGGMPGGSFNRDLRNPGRRLARGKLAFEGVEQIDVGGRTFEATRIDSADSDDDVFIRADGALLRLEYTFRNWRNAHIRLLHPSEY
jgi:hypothetical protein